MSNQQINFFVISINQELEFSLVSDQTKKLKSMTFYHCRKVKYPTNLRLIALILIKCASTDFVIESANFPCKYGPVIEKERYIKKSYLTNLLSSPFLCPQSREMTVEVHNEILRVLNELFAVSNQHSSHYYIFKGKQCLRHKTLLQREISLQ